MHPFRWLDRIIFASVLLLALQVPILADQYRQYMSGYVNALQEQVDELTALARQYGFSDKRALITHLQNNTDPIVKQDATNKARLLERYSHANDALMLLSSENYVRKTAYIFSPSNIDTLSKVASNFAPGIPLGASAVIHSIVFALIIETLLLLPVWLAKRIKRSKAVKKPA